MSLRVSYLVFGLIAAFFAVFLFWPIGSTIRGAFIDETGSLTLAYLAEVFRNPIYLEGLLNAFLFAVASTALTIVIAVPLAVLADKFVFPGKGILSAFILVPMILPPFVGAIGIKQILGREGALNVLLEKLGMLSPEATIDWLGEGRFWGIVIMNALHLYPILYLNVAAALANIDPAMEEAAANLGCVGFRRFFRITLPLILPGLFAGGTIVFIWAFTELGVPLMFDFSRVTSVQIFYGIKDIGGNPFPFALVVVMLTTSVLLYMAGKFLFGRGGYAMVAKATVQGGPRKPAFPVAIFCTLLFAGVCFVAILPHIGVVLVSFSSDWYGTILPTGWTLDHFEAALGHNLTLPSIRNSLRYAAAATVLDLVIGVAIAYMVTRSRIPGRNILDTCAMLPLAVPGLVLAFGYLAMTQEGRVFHFMNPTIDPFMILVIAYAVRRLPFVVRAAVAGFQQTSRTLEEAAENLGAPPMTALRRVTLPLIAANLTAGALLAFSFAMLEVSDSLLLAQKQEDFPITKAIFELYQLLGEGQYLASALGVWAMAFLAVSIAGATILLGKKLGSLFRV